MLNSMFQTKRGRPKIYENIHLEHSIIHHCQSNNRKEKYKDIKDLSETNQFIRNILNHSRFEIPFSKGEKKKSEMTKINYLET